jgi:hypothetical protein
MVELLPEARDLTVIRPRRVNTSHLASGMFYDPLEDNKTKSCQWKCQRVQTFNRQRSALISTGTHHWLIRSSGLKSRIFLTKCLWSPHKFKDTYPASKRLARRPQESLLLSLVTFGLSMTTALNNNAKQSLLLTIISKRWPQPMVQQHQKSRST